MYIETFYCLSISCLECFIGIFQSEFTFIRFKKQNEI